MDRRAWLVIPLIVTAGCSLGGQGGDPGQVNGPGITGPVVVPVNECMHELWLGPDMPRRSGSCERSDEGWVCVCTSGDSEDTEPSVERGSTAQFCSQALLEVCEIDVLAPNYCEALPGGCWPNDDAGSSWLCACEGDDERVSVTADACQDALGDGCSETCSDSLGTCVADLYAANHFECGCFAAGSMSSTRVNYNASCQETLEHSCGSRCSSETGSCEYADGEYNCACSDGMSVRVTASGPESPSAMDAPVVMGSNPCHPILEQTCGILSPSQGGSCESSHEGVTGRCDGVPVITRPGETQSGEPEFTCSCSAAEGEPVTHTGQSCGQVLAELCSDAIPPVPSDGGPTGDFGHLCATDECAAGSCYVPGPGSDPICGAPCMTDDDCPDFALCSDVGSTGGHCFVACDDDAACLALNNATQNRLYCADRSSWGEAAGRICVQKSEP